MIEMIFSQIWFMMLVAQTQKTLFLNTSIQKVKKKTQRKALSSKTLQRSQQTPIIPLKQSQKLK